MNTNGVTRSGVINVNTNGTSYSYAPGTYTCGNCGRIGTGPGGTRFDSPDGWLECSLCFHRNTPQRVGQHFYTWRCPDCAPAAFEQIQSFYGQKPT